MPYCSQTRETKLKKNIKKIYKSPKIKELGDAKKIIKQVFLAGTGDNQPGMDNLLASSL